MKKTKVVGVESLIGDVVQVWCVNYIYTGRLVSIDPAWLQLEGCGLIFETGELSAKQPKTIEAFSSTDRWIARCSVESIGSAS